MEKKIEEPIGKLIKQLTEVKRRPLSSFVPIDAIRALYLELKEEDINE